MKILPIDIANRVGADLKKRGDNQQFGSKQKKAVGFSTAFFNKLLARYFLSHPKSP